MATQASRAARDAAIDRVEANTDDAWRKEAEAALSDCAAKLDEFTADDVWLRITAAPREPRALGAVMRYAHKMAIIAPTETWRTTSRASSHARPLRVWKSLMRSAGATNV
jgi:hypothetical protein